MLGCMLEIGVGIATAAHIVISTPNVDLESDLIGHLYHKEDIIEGSGVKVLNIEKGNPHLTKEPGLGIQGEHWMKIKEIRVDIVRIPFKKPFTMAMWTSKEKIHVVVRMISEEGIVGVGESVPLVAEFGEPTGGIKEIIEHYFSPVLIGVDIYDIEEIYQRLNSSVKFHWFAKSAIDFAVYDLMGKTKNIPVYNFLGGLNNDKILLNWVIGIQNPENAAKEADHYFKLGYRSFKLKAREAERAIETLKEVRAVVKNRAKIRVDANQSWSVAKQ